MTSPFSKFEELQSVWARATVVVNPDFDIVVDVRFPPDTFPKLQGYLERDMAIMSVNRLLRRACSGLDVHNRCVFTKGEIDRAATLTLEQIDRIVDADSKSDTIRVRLIAKTAECFVWGAPMVRQDGASELETALLDTIKRANRVMSRADAVLMNNEPVQVFSGCV